MRKTLRVLRLLRGYKSRKKEAGLVVIDQRYQCSSIQRLEVMDIFVIGKALILIVYADSCVRCIPSFSIHSRANRTFIASSPHTLSLPQVLS